MVTRSVERTYYEGGRYFKVPEPPRKTTLMPAFIEALVGHLPY